MGLLDTIRAGVRVANKITKPLQSVVTYQQVTAVDGYGKPSSVGSPVTLRAIVDFNKVPVRNPEGITEMTRATVTLLDAAAVATATGGQGVAVGDIFTLADGTVGRVLDIGGFMDAGTNQPIPTTVMLG